MKIIPHKCDEMGAKIGRSVPVMESPCASRIRSLWRSGCVIDRFLCWSWRLNWPVPCSDNA